MSYEKRRLKVRSAAARGLSAALAALALSATSMTLVLVDTAVVGSAAGKAFPAARTS